MRLNVSLRTDVGFYLSSRVDDLERAIPKVPVCANGRRTPCMAGKYQGLRAH